MVICIISYYNKNELIIPYDKLEQGNNGEVLSFNTNLTPKNFYIERIFREKSKRNEWKRVLC